MLRKRKKDEVFSPLNQTIIVLLHGGYWLIYLLLLTVISLIAGMHAKLAVPNLAALLPLIILFLAPNLTAFYSFYFLLFTRFLKTGKIFALIIFGAFAGLFSALFGLLLSLVFFGFEQAIFSDAREFFFLVAVLFAIAVIHGSIALVIRGFIVWFTEIKLKEELAQKKFEMELELIKSQINPHFLFNTINNIDFLITKDAAKASAYLNKLSDILRYMVYDTKDEQIPLEKELNYIEKYLELHKIRTTNPNYINFEVKGDANNLTIAPMLFFPFIENAFKHTENNKNSNNIAVKILISDKQICFECENTYQKSLQKSDYGGLGNELIERRLMLLYPNKHLLEIVDDEEIYKVKLTINEN